MIDLTPIFQAIIALLAALVTTKLIPWIKSKTSYQQQQNLAAAARIAVYAAEQLYGSGNGETKLEYAIKALEGIGYHLDKAVLRLAIENAVRAMNVWGDSATIPDFQNEHPPEEIEQPE